MILIDSNIPIYLVGRDPALKARAQRGLERLFNNRERLVTDAEVLQEILHRYTLIKRPDAIQAAFDVLLGFVDEVFAIDHATVERAKQIVLGYPRLSARDAIHVAVMQREGIGRILTFDAEFDGLPGITRIV